MLRLFIPRSVIGVGVWFGILIFVPLAIGYVASLVIAQLIETAGVLGLILQAQGAVTLATVQALLQAPALGFA